MAQVSEPSLLLTRRWRGVDSNFQFRGTRAHSDGAQAARRRSKPRASRAILASRLRRMPHIDRATELLVAVCYGPTHARLGEKDGQDAAQPYVFIGLAMTVFARAKPRHCSLAPAWLEAPRWRAAPVSGTATHREFRHDLTGKLELSKAASWQLLVLFWKY